LLLCSSYLPLGVPNWTVKNHQHRTASQISILEDKVSGLVAQVSHLKECDSFLIDFIESACEQLKCKFPTDLLDFLVASFVFVF
jgi:hypothetical protein